MTLPAELVLAVVVILVVVHNVIVVDIIVVAVYIVFIQYEMKSIQTPLEICKPRLVITAKILSESYDSSY